MVLGGGKFGLKEVILLEAISIYQKFEKEFGRELSPMEQEFIQEWKTNNFSEETIALALRESVYNGVKSFRYIDKILQNWNNEETKNRV